jgi:hypothetical protein
MWSIGYKAGVVQSRPPRTWPSLATASDDEFVCCFQQLARELGIAIALTYLEKRPGKPCNSVSLIDRNGTTLSVIRQPVVPHCGPTPTQPFGRPLQTMGPTVGATLSRKS